MRAFPPFNPDRYRERLWRKCPNQKCYFRTLNDSPLKCVSFTGTEGWKIPLHQRRESRIGCFDWLEWLLCSKKKKKKMDKCPPTRRDFAVNVQCGGDLLTRAVSFNSTSPLQQVHLVLWSYRIMYIKKKEEHVLHAFLPLLSTLLPSNNVSCCKAQYLFIVPGYLVNNLARVEASTSRFCRCKLGVTLTDGQSDGRAERRSAAFPWLPL